MPQVPGTKVWLRNKDLADALDAIEMATPPQRLLIAEELAEESVHRSRQSFERNYFKVHRFILLCWFNMHLKMEG